MEKLTFDTIDSDGAISLAIAVVKSVCDDYTELLRKLRKNPDNKDAMNKLIALRRTMHKKPFTAFCLQEPDEIIKTIELDFIKSNNGRRNNRIL
jgi:hypothetical protein